MKHCALVAVLALLSAGPLHAQDASKQLAAQARTVFKTHCHRCHFGEGSEAWFDVLNAQTLTADIDGNKAVVVPGKLDKSKLWQRAGVKKNMPPKSIIIRPSPAELDILRRWIEAGAPAFPTEEKNRKFLTLAHVLTAIRDHLRGADAEDRPYLRYFTLTHLYNNAKVPDADLAVYRAALSKAINSLSGKPRIVLPQPVDAEATIFAIDIRDLDWDRDHLWQAVMAAYPYGLTYDGHPDRAIQKLDDDIRTQTRCKVPAVRGDWFAVTATRPPLYHVLLKIPKTARALEASLKVDVLDNFRRNRLDRAGFNKSGVSEQNRLVERHEADHGAYWKSYDFKKNSRTGNLTQQPLGPLFVGHPYPKTAFVQDGGEIIFNLANGLQGYMLVNAKDERIDEGPIDVVSDSQKTAGSNVIVTGLSCIACHARGMKALPADVIRDGAAVFGDVRRKVAQLYPEKKRMDTLVKDDEERFQRAAEKATGPFLKVGADKDRALDSFPEPVGEIARLYNLQALDLAMLACELGIEKPEELRGMIRGNKSLREVGLKPVDRESGALLRADWEKGTTSLMQRVARELELGTPVRILADR